MSTMLDSSMLYLKKHDLEQLVSDALVRVVNEKPDDPRAAMAELLLNGDQHATKLAAKKEGRVNELLKENAELRDRLKQMTAQQVCAVTAGLNSSGPRPTTEPAAEWDLICACAEGHRADGKQSDHRKRGVGEAMQAGAACLRLPAACVVPTRNPCFLILCASSFGGAAGRTGCLIGVVATRFGRPNFDIGCDGAATCSRGGAFDGEAAAEATAGEPRSQNGGAAGRCRTAARPTSDLGPAVSEARAARRRLWHDFREQD